ncbi:hypothetical protein ABFS82_09G003300 [Erythranthe guttata]|uniref:GON-4-like protein n=1 Tax=Erythranthe guttata TaxID=4155 RepID=UPI00064DDD28|nr:PREDICTED: GON-4-like protein [Erythranthe guttata]|eukprot:XP_012855625.1 PREDICTED: GON-4-like protein [Erythranthe guttata]
MEGCSTSVSTEVQDPNHQNAAIRDCANLPDTSALPPESEVEEKQEQGGDNGNQNVHEEEDDDEDTDFNPFVKETDYVEASSSLSSEVEDLDTDVADSREKPCAEIDLNFKEKHGDIMKDCHTSRSVEIGEEIVEQTTFSSGEACGKGTGTTCDVTSEKELVLIPQSENGFLCSQENRLTNLTDVGSNGADSKKPMVDMDTDDAICMRTRARYSLASFTLDELETFLQETDDEDDLQNVDDEVEYRKFLAAVLMGDDSENLQGNANADDEDEENDADFELELEEALESEPEEIEERRTTRRNRSQKASLARNKKLSGQLNRPLRPLLPFASIGCFPAFDGKNLPPNIAPSFMPPVNIGFTPHQIGQLHCLIHEHVQLLIQVFSICVLEPDKGHIAADVKELVVEMLEKRDQVLTNKMIPYPSFCFSPPYIHPSATDGQKMLPPNGRGLHSDISSSSSQRNKNVMSEQASSSQTTERTSWVPYICGPILSVMDVAPLRLAGNYVDEVSSVVRAYKRSQIEVGFENLLQKEPLFPLHSSPCSAESDGQGEIENTPQDSNRIISCSPKKTMAAALLEKTKNEPVALVPKEIAKLAQRFWPLFNPALYPHKPPPASLTIRVLFTDAEDELLALGLMEYNNDWKAIQKRFLPCKSRHQIFVRQKNRSSSKAPGNPIKAVRTIKNSPLSSEEIARIEMGLKRFKLDWISIWRFFVPYRDPSLLPRQWRIACGTQKSYKSDATKNAKRRLYALKRKTSKPSTSNRHSSTEKEDDSTDNAVEETKGDNHLRKEDEAYVHEAFLADWRPNNNVSSSLPTSLPSHENSQAKDIQPQIISNSPAASRPANSQVILRPYRTRRPNNARLVKLAPGLPPVNLPASVRIMSQSDFKSSQAVASAKISVNTSRMAGAVVENRVASSAKSVPSTSNSVCITASNKRVEVPERGGDSVLQMHPLLFQSPQNASSIMPYYPVNSTTSTSSSFTFFSGKQQPKLSLGLFHNPRHIKDAVNFLSMSSKTPPQENASSLGVDFHPLLQRSDDIDTASAPSIAESSRLERSSGTKVASLKGKVNELDLNFHPSFTSNSKHSESPNDSSKNSGETRMVKSRTKGSRKCSDIAGSNESIQEIVMEQEELSDSEEEFGENVEFECEEMADSEGDSLSDSEQIVDLQDEDEMDVDIDNTSEKVINVKPKILSLNLNSFPPLSPNPNEFEPFGATSTFAQNRPIPSSKGSSSKNVKPGQIKKSSKDTTLPRNPRKRVSRSKSNSIPKMEMNVEKKSKNVSTDE